MAARYALLMLSQRLRKEVRRACVAARRQRYARARHAGKSCRWQHDILCSMKDRGSPLKTWSVSGGQAFRGSFLRRAVKARVRSAFSECSEVKGARAGSVALA